MPFYLGYVNDVGIQFPKPQGSPGTTACRYPRAAVLFIEVLTNAASARPSEESGPGVRDSD